MNFCCHDDYTSTGSFNLDDSAIYSAHRLWVYQKKPTADGADENADEITKFSEWYAWKASRGDVPTLANPIVTLPVMDCGDFTQTGSFNLDDSAIYSAHRLWVYQKKPTADGADENADEITKFSEWYAWKASRGDVPTLANEIKHLPSLETDSVVHTIDGDVAKGGDGLTTEIDTTEGSVGDLLVSLDCNSAVHLGTYTGEQIKAVELVFDNVQFTPESDSVTGLSITDGDKETLVNTQFKDTLDKATLNYYYDYSIRTDGTEPRKNRSVIGFIDTTENGNGEAKTTLGQLQFRVNADRYSIITEIATEPVIADVRIYDDTAEVERYELVSCGSDTSTD